MPGQKLPQRERACVAENKVQNIQVLAAEHVPVPASAVGVAVHDGRSRSREHEHIDALGHIPALAWWSLP